ncbi:kynureninase [Tropicimonas isoalkanivorans]|uniref:Kynureninase n=1 Tax=Tropicimonas isoalkanivorans TaxID=441112 RepID=A0A1I1GB92_9RHOB|nr:kynureninase [Tropicimonas isoalkanivorans]SFC08582.1 Kynureninase [Tropicimonas isoalkanivorans]
MTDFAWTRDQFLLPDGVIYLDGNSLGPMPKAAPDRVARVLQPEWRDMLIGGWVKAGWHMMPETLGDRIAALIGAEPGHVVVGDTLSIKVYQALAAALALRPERRVILSDTGNFPSDLYMAEGLARTLGHGTRLVTVAPEDVAEALTDEVAVLMLTEVDYRTGRRHDVAALTARAHEVSALTVWDLAHSFGAVPVDLAAANVDFAAGCTYKYINAGPGAPAFIYVAPRHAEKADTALQGWQGHDAPFAFDPAYRPASKVARMRVGTPPVLQLAALDAALDVWDQVDIHDVRARSIALSERFIAGVEETCPQLRLASPRDPERRGSQVSFHFEHGYAAMQALIARGVVGDFRAPDIMRFGLTPLYIGEAEVDRAVEILAEIMKDRLWDNPDYKVKAIVT